MKIELGGDRRLFLGLVGLVLVLVSRQAAARAVIDVLVDAEPWICRCHLNRSK